MNSNFRTSPDVAWNYILRLYGVDGMQSTCLDLQDKVGVDVVFLLWLLWLGCQQSRVLSETSILDLERATRSWREATILPIRGARRASGKLAKTGDHDAQLIYDQLKQLELSVERVLLRRLMEHEDWGSEHPNPDDAAATNVKLYLGTLVSADVRSWGRVSEFLVGCAIYVSKRR